LTQQKAVKKLKKKEIKTCNQTFEKSAL